jgi:hypothetical protein
MSDRTVAAVLTDGAEIVRYDRASKYFVEFPPSAGKTRKLLSIGAAASMAVEDGGAVRRSAPRRFLIECDKKRRELTSRP